MKIPYIKIDKKKLLKIWFKKKNILNTKIIEYLTENKLSAKEIEKIIVRENLEEEYNFVLTVLHYGEKISLEENCRMEEQVYEGVGEEERKVLIIKNFQTLIENCLNQLIKNESQLEEEEGRWVVTNLDSLYFIGLEHLEIEKKDLKKMLPRTKNKKLAKEIIKINIIVSTLERSEDIVLYNKNKKKVDGDNEWVREEINFTKGYSVCLNPNLVMILKNYRYPKKTIKNQPTIIKILKNDLNVLESLDNKNFSNPLWIKNFNEDLIREETIKNKNMFKEKSKIEKVVNVINSLNATKLAHNEEVFKKIYNIIDRDKVDTSLNTKKSAIIYVNKMREEFEDLTENNMTSKKTVINSAGALELIKDLLKEKLFFYIENRLDWRTRVYCWAWPINYQLSHIIRACILISQETKINEIYFKFRSHHIIKKYLHYKNIFLHEEISRDTMVDIKNKFYLWREEEGCIIDLKIEGIVMMLSKISTTKETGVEEKVKSGLKNLKEFIEADLEKSWKDWCLKLKIKKKKFPYILQMQSGLIDALTGNFDSTWWSDASSNAIQLISLRMGSFNEELMMLTNIIDNKTKYENIYEYVTQALQEKDHKEIIESLEIKITEETLKEIISYDLIKYLIMPSSYGMGKRKFRLNLEEVLEDKEIKVVEKLSTKDKSKISEYIWEEAFKEMKKVGFDIEKYKKICSNYWKEGGYEGFAWENDFGIKICPINEEKSKRTEIRKRLNILNMKKKECLEDKKKEKLEKECEQLKKKLTKDDKKFWKRSMVITKKNKIYARIYFPETKIDKHKTRQSLVPNTIHSYDASIICFVSEICNEIGIGILPIHDSIGSKIITAPLVKIIFKIVNIEFMIKASKKEPFPLNKPIEFEEKIIEKIIKSKNFFR